jgi:hypothetical protein
VSLRWFVARCRYPLENIWHHILSDDIIYVLGWLKSSIIIGHGMTQITLDHILKQLDTFELDELKQLNKTILKYVSEREEPLKKAAFHQALLDAGLVKQIKHPTERESAERPLIQVEGKPVSETILESRR